MTHCHHHAECRKSAMEDAEKTCEARGLRLTDIRKKVLNIIWQSHKAVTAAQVMQHIGADQPPTTYRALEFLQKAGLIHHITSINAYIGCPHPEEPHQSQLLICADCHTVEEIHSSKLEDQLTAIAQKHAFTVTEQHVEVLGHCATCRS